MKIFSLFLLFDLIFLTNGSPDYFQPNSILNAYLEPLPTERITQEYSGIRIKLFFNESIPNDSVHRKWIQQAIDFFSSSLKVKPFNSRIFIERNCDSKKVQNIREQTNEKFETYCDGRCSRYTYCSSILVPEDHLNQCKHCSTDQASSCRKEQNKGSGVIDSDLIFYVGSINTYTCKSDNTVAYASWCAKEKTLDRPIAGSINICPFTKQMDLAAKREFVETIMHEVMHVLVFSTSLFGYFRDQNGSPLTERNEFGKPIGQPNKLKFNVSDKVVKFVQRDWHVRGNVTLKKEAALIVTPKVVQEVRAHFNCSTLEGAELEDSDGSYSHWEARLFQGEVMHPEADMNMVNVFSRISFALLEDTGWYQVNYSFAEPLEFGKNLGCDFCTKSCKYWMDTQSDPSPYCKKPRGHYCTFKRKAYGKCKLKKYDKELDSLYQYFDHIKDVPDNETGFYGGNTKADYCPTITPFKWANSRKGTECLKSSNTPNIDDNRLLENYGQNARCFEYKKSWEVIEFQGTCMMTNTRMVLRKTGCYKYSCEDGWLHIYVQDRKYTCFKKGQIIKVQILEPLTTKLHKGTIICPSCEDICKNNGWCNPDNSYKAQHHKYKKDKCIENVVNRSNIRSTFKPTSTTEWIPFWVPNSSSPPTQEWSTQSTTTRSDTVSSVPWTALIIIGLIALALIIGALLYFLFKSEKAKKSKAKKSKTKMPSEIKSSRKMTKGKN